MVESCLLVLVLRLQVMVMVWVTKKQVLTTSLMSIGYRCSSYAVDQVESR